MEVFIGKVSVSKGELLREVMIVENETSRVPLPVP